MRAVERGVLFTQHAVIMDGTARYAWPGGLRLAADLAEVIDLRGKRVVELGSGSGVVAAAADALGAASVIASDGDASACAALRQHFCTHPRITVAEYAWDDTPPWQADVVLGGDITYRAPHIPQLMRCIAALLARDGVALLADPRSRLEDELPLWAQQAGLTCDNTARPGPYTLVRLRVSARRAGNSL